MFFGLFLVETARAIGSGRVGGGQALRQNISPQQSFVGSQQPSAVMQANVDAASMSYPTIDQFIPPQQIQRQQQHQQEQVKLQIQYLPTPTSGPLAAPMQVPVSPPIQKPMSNVINGVPFKLPSVQDRLIKNRVFFDENLKNEAQPSNGKAVAGNQ